MAISFVGPREASTTQLHASGREFVLHDYFGSFQASGPGSQCFEVNLTTPQGVIPPHYHEVDQFQVVVGGAATIGKHALPMGAIHYTDRYTPYGPIHAGEAGLDFFTLRLEQVTGAYFMPASRDLKEERSGHTFTGLTDLRLPVVRSMVAELGAAPHGARAMEIRTTPGEDPGVVAGGLRPGYYLVMAGELQGPSREFPARSCVSVDDRVPTMGAVAGPRGAVLVHVQFRRAG